LNFNQQEIDSFDQHICRDERANLQGRVRTFCKLNDILFTINISAELIQNSKQSVIVFMWLSDLIANYEFWRDIDHQLYQQGKILLVVTDNVINFNNLPCVKFFSYPKLLGYTASYNDNITYYIYIL
jgi:hypothetical protein